MTYTAIQNPLQYQKLAECDDSLHFSTELPPLSILDFAEMISPTDEEIAEGRTWLATTHERFEANMARNAVVNAWEMNAISSEKAVLALIENNAFDFDNVMWMIATHARTCAVIDGEV
jgi:hypothetical protein